MMEEKEGELLVGLARRAIYRYLKERKIAEPPEKVKDELQEKMGVFVTLNTFPDNNLRGCIGLPEPVKPLVEGVIEAAISSAISDPRFYPLGLDELQRTTIDVTVLTPPEVISKENPLDFLNEIEIGKHGLIIEKKSCRGLLLPQVPVEHGWDKYEYLSCLCMKAGLPEEAWKERGAKISRFEGVVFSEESPGGRVKKRELT